MLKIGLTGGIGSGKSTAAQYFATLSRIPVIDADSIARELVQRGSMLFKSRVFNKIVQHFGPQVLTKDGAIDRACLRKIIFNNDCERQWLEKLLHPLIYAEIERSIKKLTKKPAKNAQKPNAPYCLIVAPLLLETNGAIKVDRVLVVHAVVENQTKRIAQRDHANQDDIKNIINAQLKQGTRLSQADDIIDNNGSLSDLQQQIIKLHYFYSDLSKQSAKQHVCKN